MECSKKRELDLMAAKIRKTALQTIQAAGSGHIGGSFSIADILSVLYFEKMNVDPMRPDDPDRDRLVLSKGHCSPAMYATLALKGFFLKEHLSTFRKLDSDLSGHVEIHVPGVDMSSGSLGQGLSVALGMAMYAKARKKRYRTFCILGDGEIQEGQVWEAAMCAGFYKVDNLIAFVDNNKLQLDGSLEEIMSSYPIGDKFRAFGSGMDVIIVQPVDPDAIEEVCKEALDSDIEVVCWDEKMENSSFNWVIENYDLGVEIGTQAADFINEKFGDKGCEVVVLGYPQTPILLERENGILDALKEKAPNAEVVANQPAIDTTEGLNAMETILQAHPDVKVVCCIGGGGATGANEALKGTYGSEVPDDIGIFSTDLTDEAIASMQNGEFDRCVVAITGNAFVCGDVIYDLSMRYAAGEKLDHEVYRDLIPVTPENLEEMITK